MQNCCLFCLCLSFRLKVIKMYLFWKKKSSIFSFRVNDTLTSILSALHPFLTLPNDDLKRERVSRVSVCPFQAISLKAQKGTFFAVGSEVLKSVKMVPVLQLEVMLLKVRKRYLFKNIK